MAKYTVTVDEETHTIDAERCMVEGGDLIFYGYAHDSNVYGVTKAIAKGSWSELSLVYPG